MGARCAVTTGFCRDCLADAPPQGQRCAACGSPRLLRHDELDALAIAHIDCDAFYATIEKRDDPALADFFAATELKRNPACAGAALGPTVNRASWLDRNDAPPPLQGKKPL